MPYDESKLSADIQAALAIPVPDGEDAAMATVEEIAAGIAAGITANPGETVLSNEERVQALEDELQALTDRVGELESFVDTIEQRLSPVESTVNAAKAAGKLN